MLIILIGAPFAGKKTLARHLCQSPELVGSKDAFSSISLSCSTSSSSSSSSTPSSDTLSTPNGQQDGGEVTFQSSSSFLHFVTKNYTQNYVTTSLTSPVDILNFLKRPFVALVCVQAPLGERFARATSSSSSPTSSSSSPPLSLSEFVSLDDSITYGSLSSLLPHVHLTLSSTHPSSSLFLSSLSPLPSLLNTLSASLRPPWDEYFMKLSLLASLRSNCMKRRVGAVLVRERRVVSTGYNGTPRGVRNCMEGGCKRCNNAGEELTGGMGVGLDECLCLHAEENALLEAGRERVSGGGTVGAVLYCNTCPCIRCTVKIVQCGVTEVVYSLSYSMDDASRRVLEEAGVTLRQMSLPVL